MAIPEFEATITKKKMKKEKIIKILPYALVLLLIGYIAYPKLKLLSKPMTEETSASNPEQELISQCVRSFGTTLIACCSSVEPENGSIKRTWSDYRKLPNGDYEITVKVEWIGGAFKSKTPYWISGWLTVDGRGCNPRWRKSHDSGMFKPGCGKRCKLPDCL